MTGSVTDPSTGRFWISPGARLWLAALTTAVAVAVALVVIPANAERAKRAEERKQAEAQQLQDTINTQHLLRRFDCTYGVAVKSTLVLIEQAYHRQAQISLTSRHRQLMDGNKRGANTALRSRRNAQRAERRFRHLRLELQPLANPGPKCP